MGFLMKQKLLEMSLTESEIYSIESFTFNWIRDTTQSIHTYFLNEISHRIDKIAISNHIRDISDTLRYWVIPWEFETPLHD